jgi:metallo-beta-lactamase class B
VFGNTYFVGTAGLSAVLITSDDGAVLIDGGLSQSAPIIDANIRTLGFRTEDVRLILNSHAHFDHAGGIAALQRHSRAVVAAGAAGARALQRGEPTPDDPQFGFGREANRFPVVRKVRGVRDGEVLRVGDLAVTAHLTPGHTPGSTTWTWRSCEGLQCLNMVYADSVTALSAPGFRFTGEGKEASIVESFRRSLATIEQLPCDILLTPHPASSGLDQKLQRRAAQPETNPFIDGNACRAYAAEGRKALERRIAEEKGLTPPLEGQSRR